MALNYQDVIRDVHDPANHALQISGTIQAAGQATVNINGSATLFAVVNTSAAGQSSIVLDTGANWIGLASVRGNVNILSAPTINAVVNTGSATDPKIYIGLVTSTIGNNPILGAGVNNIGFATVAISNPTLYAVVNTGAAGVGNSIVTVANPNFGINAGVNGIGFATVNVVNQPALVASAAYIGLVTVANTVPVTFSGNVTITDSKGFIGLTTSVNGSAWPDPKTYIGLASVNVANTVNSTLIGSVTIQDGGNSITIDGNVGVLGNVTISDSKGFIGLTTTTLGASPAFIGIVTIANSNARSIVGNVTLSDSNNFIGLVTSINGAGTQFIGLVTAVTRNAGTNKALVQLPVGLGNNSLTTIAVPTNNQKINVTQLVLNSNITTSLAIKSGVTYLTGNASLAITLFPGGGFVMNGSPDSPVWISLPSGAMVVEKRDTGGTVANLTGHVIYFDE